MSRRRAVRRVRRAPMLIVLRPGSPSSFSFFYEKAVHVLHDTPRGGYQTREGPLRGPSCRNGRKKFPHQGLSSSPYLSCSPSRITLTLFTNGLQQPEGRRHLERSSKREDHLAITDRSTPCNLLHRKSSSSSFGKLCGRTRTW